MVPYFPLGDAIMRQIVELQLKRIARRVTENYKAEFTYDPACPTASPSAARRSNRVHATLTIF